MKETKIEYITIPKLAKIMGLSRIAVYKKVKKGQIPAQRIGRTYVIPKAYVDEILGKSLKEDKKKLIDKAVKKTIHEYGETLKRLGNQ